MVPSDGQNHQITNSYWPLSRSAELVRRMVMKTSVIQAADLAATPSQVLEALTGTAVAGWRAKKSEIVWGFDIVGEHVTVKLHIAARTPASLSLVCTGETGDLGWVGTRIHLAIASTERGGARIAVVHGGIPTDGAGRDAWRQLFAELAATVEHQAAA